VETLTRLLGCLLLPAIAGGVSCSSHDCTAMGCTDNDTISFALVPTSGADVPPGTYVVAVTTDKGSSTLSCTRPPTVAMYQCDGSTTSVGGNYDTGACPEGKGCIDVWISTHPATLDIVVSRDGSELTRRSLTPSYTVLQPNGPECGPACARGNVEPSTIAL
jgi:hypothetical protein